MHIQQQKYAKNMHQKFLCEPCDYECSKKFLWTQHLSTRKHKMATQATDRQPKNMQNVVLHVCEQCGRQYKQRSGLWRHKKKCNVVKKEEKIEKTNDDMTLLVKEMMIHMKNQGKIINDMIPKIGNNYNNQFNINVFLNENCRDAINMSDFIKSLHIKFGDLDYIKDNGLMEGISTVFINKLKQLDTCKRPIHCTDIKRETLYIKDNNEWEKDYGKQKIKVIIENLAHKHREAITDWEANNPDWAKTEKGKDDYILLVQNLMSDVQENNDENRIIKNIVKTTMLTEDNI